MMSIKAYRKDFTILRKEKPPIYFDNACMTLKPDQVIEAMNRYYQEFPGCGGRSYHKIGQRVTDEVEKARKALRSFIGARKTEEIVFTRNATESFNILARSFPFRKGDLVLTSDKEHNSNLLPWMGNKDLKTLHVKSRPDNTFDLDAFEKTMSSVKVRMVSIVHTSNLDGVTTPLAEVIRIAHRHGALVMADAAQSVPHMSINVRKLDVDFLAISGHKMLGPSGIGLLYGKAEHLEKLSPFLLGGDTVKDSTYESYELEDVPERFEAGLQNYAGMIGFAEAARYLEKVGVDSIGKHQVKLNTMITEGLSDLQALQVIGPANAELRSGIFSFNLGGFDPHSLAMMLDSSSDIMIRSGAHCVHSWFNAHKLDGSARASLYLYNTEEEANAFIGKVKELSALKS